MGLLLLFDTVVVVVVVGNSSELAPSILLNRSELCELILCNSGVELSLIILLLLLLPL